MVMKILPFLGAIMAESLEAANMVHKSSITMATR